MRDKGLAGKIAVVTGAGRGIGRTIALTLADHGASIAVVDITLESLDETITLLHQKGIKTIRIAGDVSDWISVRTFISQVYSSFGAIHILVNNAGIQGPIGPLVENDVDSWIRTIQINLIGPFLCCKAVLPFMLKQKYGRIINLSGGGATGPRSNFSAYAASKVGVVRLTETLAEELKGQNIMVNAIAPGAVNTHMLTEVLNAGSAAGEKGIAEVQRQLETGGTPPELAAALVVFLASESANGLTGKLVAAPHDSWQEWDEERIKELMSAPWFTLRRIDPLTLKPFIDILRRND